MDKLHNKETMSISNSIKIGKHITTSYDETNIANISKDLKNYDYVYVKTKTDIMAHIGKNYLQICAMKLGENSYFCSDKFYLINGHIHGYDYILPFNHSYNGSTSYSFTARSGEYFIKYNQKDELNFFNESLKEIELLRKFQHSGLFFMEQQKLIDAEITSDYSLSVRKFIEGETLEKNTIQRLSSAQKLHILEDIFEQLAFLECNGYIYNDLRNVNLMLTEEGRAILIDLGSYYKKPQNGNGTYHIANFSRLDAYNLLDMVLLLVYNFFNAKGNYCENPYFSQETLRKIKNGDNYSAEILWFVYYLKRKKYTKYCSYAAINRYFKKHRGAV